MHWLSAQNVIYALGQEVPKLVYAFLMCKPVSLSGIRLPSIGNRAGSQEGPGFLQLLAKSSTAPCRQGPVIYNESWKHNVHIQVLPRIQLHYRIRAKLFKTNLWIHSSVSFNRSCIEINHLLAEIKSPRLQCKGLDHERPSRLTSRCAPSRSWLITYKWFKQESAHKLTNRWMHATKRIISLLHG